MAAHAAARSDAAALAALLCASPELVHERDSAGDTPLHAAAEGCEAAAVAVLLDAGAEPDARNHSGETPLLRHVKKSPLAPDDTAVVDLLLSRRADVNATDIAGVSPLTEAAFEGKSPLLARLLQPDAKADLHATRDGQSLLAMARTPADRRLLHQHPDSPHRRLSSAFASASRRMSVLAPAPLEPLLVRTAAIATTEARGVTGTACLGEPGPLHDATCRLVHGSVAAAFAPEAAPLPQDDAPVPEALDVAFAGVSVSSSDAAAARPARPPAPAEVVERRALRLLLPMPPSAWVPPKAGDPFCLSAPDVLDLCTRAHSLFNLEPSVLRLRAPVKIFGDTHGQYADLMHLFDAFGSPSPEGDLCATDYLFLGDYVDRGRHQLETVCLVLALKARGARSSACFLRCAHAARAAAQLAYPTQVHVLRGNHEIFEVNARMHDFLAHCRARFGARDGKAVHTALNDVFDMMPLGAVVETPPQLQPPGAPPPPPPTRVFCVHGGVGRLQRIEKLEALQRPLSLNIDPAELEGAALADRQLADDALWSDPAARDGDAELEAAGGVEENTRGAGMRFGPSVLRAFCVRNGVAALVRAHQVPLAGVEPFAGGLGVTVFSAADYPETASYGDRDLNAAALLWMGRDGRLYPRILLPSPRPPPPPRTPPPPEKEFSD